MAGRPATLKVDIVTDAKGDGIDATSSKLGKMGKIGMVAGAAVAAGIGVAVVAGAKLLSMAAEDQKSQVRLAQTLKNTTGARKNDVAAVEDWISKQGEALGVTDDELRPALGRLAQATGDVGKAQKLTALAMDVSAGTGKSLGTVTEALAKAQNGSLGGLARLGVATKDANGETLSLEQITRKLAETHKGQAAKAANTAAGQFGRLKLQLSEGAEAIGAKMLPYATKLGAWLLNKGVPAAKRLAGELREKLGPAFTAIGGFIRNTVIPAAVKFYGWFVEKIAPGIKKAVTPVIDGLRAGFDKVRGAVSENEPQLRKIGDALKKVAEFIAQKVMPVVGDLIGKGFRVLGTVIGGVVDGIAALTDGIGWAIDKIQQLIDWIGKIDMPDLPDLGDLNPFGANVATIGYRLVGDVGSLDGRRSWSTAAAGGPSLSTVLRGAARPGGATVVDARTFLTVNVDGSGVVDEHKIARELAAVLARWANRMGRPITELLAAPAGVVL